MTDVFLFVNTILSNLLIENGQLEEEKMRDESQILSFLDCSMDSFLNRFMCPGNIIQEKLSNFGLTQNESRIIIFLNKYGSKSAIEITRLLNISRTETYRVISILQGKGIVSSTIDHPVKFSALPIEETLDLLIKTELENVHVLQNQKNEIIELCNSVPSFIKDNTIGEEKIQILRGQNPIISKVNEMIQGVQKNLFLLGSEKSFMRFYHSNSLDMLQNTSAEIKALILCSKDPIPIFEKMKNIKIRKLSKEFQKDLCIMIKDEKEIIFFTRNDNQSSHNITAIKTDSLALIYSMIMMFEQIWSTSKKLI